MSTTNSLKLIIFVGFCFFVEARHLNRQNRDLTPQAKTVHSSVDGAIRSKILNPGKPPKHMGQEGGHHIEGDIVIDTKKGGAADRNAITSEKYRWPNGVVAYQFATNLPAAQRQAFMDAIADYHMYTCIRFKQRTTEADYIEVSPLEGCYSYMGRNGGKQPFSLGTGCDSKGVAIHELMHTLGFGHEQSRADRDQFVQIRLENVQKGKENNFDLYGPAQGFSTMGMPYDYSSVMHYGKGFMTKNGQDTIVPKDPNAQIGQRFGFSELDAKKINSLYKCDLSKVGKVEQFKRGFNKFLEFSSNDKNEVVNRINQMRRDAGTKPLAWNLQAETIAKDIAKTCSSKSVASWSYQNVGMYTGAIATQATKVPNMLLDYAQKEKAGIYGAFTGSSYTTIGCANALCGSLEGTDYPSATRTICILRR